MRALKSARIFIYMVFKNSILISPLLQSAINFFSPFSLFSGRLHSPFLILQEIEKSSQPPIIEPVISPFLAFRLTDLPAFTRSHITSPPSHLRLKYSVNESAPIEMLSLVVVAENEVSRLSGIPILILR